MKPLHTRARAPPFSPFHEILRKGGKTDGKRIFYRH
jgi:hypothetical protein